MAWPPWLGTRTGDGPRIAPARVDRHPRGTLSAGRSPRGHTIPRSFGQARRGGGVRVNRRAFGARGGGMLAFLAGLLLASAGAAGVPEWPAVTAESRPWTRLWWMGS